MVTSSAVVGFVRDQQIRLTGKRHGDGDALGAGRRKNWWGGRHRRALRHRKSPTRSSNAIAFPGALGLPKKPRCLRNGSSTWRPTVCIGLSAVIGS